MHTFYPADFWATDGGDFDAVSSATAIVVSAPIAHTWGSTVRMVSDVQCWLDVPGCNNGWLLQGNETDLHTAKRFASREWFDPAQRPLLTIEYTTPVACPADLDGDGEVGINDFLMLLAAWGTPAGDVDGDGDTGIGDFLDLLAAWGPCA